MSRESMARVAIVGNDPKRDGVTPVRLCATVCRALLETLGYTAHEAIAAMGEAHLAGMAAAFSQSTGGDAEATRALFEKYIAECLRPTFDRIMVNCADLMREDRDRGAWH